MATAQEIRKKTRTLKKPANLTSSKECIKQLVALTVSTIAYQRALFPDSCFRDEIYAGVPCKILNEKKKCVAASSLMEWINNAFEAFDIGCLKEMILCLEPDTAECGEVIEAYKFLFNYNHNEINFSSQDSNGKCINVEVNEMPEICELLKSAKTIPEPDPTNIYENLKMYLRLTYYEEAKPLNYEPKGFHKAAVPLTFKHPTCQMSFSDVSTNWHSLKIKSKLFENPHALQAGENMIRNNLKNEKITNGQPTESGKALDIALSGVISISSNGRKGAQKPSEMQTTVVSCACGCDKESHDFKIKCSSCSFWQHRACYGLIDDEDPPQKGCCFLCSAENEEKICFDPVLIKLNYRDRKSLCTYRRVLAYCERNNRINFKSMASDLNLSEILLYKVTVQLEGDNVITMNRRGRYSLVRIVDINKLKNIVMPKYFSKIYPRIPKLF